MKPDSVTKAIEIIEQLDEPAIRLLHEKTKLLMA